MKRLILSILALGMLIGFSGCSEENENLQICGIEYGKQGDYFKPTIQNFADAPHIELANKYKNKNAPRDGVFMFLEQDYGDPTDTFSLADIKKKD